MYRFLVCKQFGKNFTSSSNARSLNARLGGSSNFMPCLANNGRQQSTTTTEPEAAIKKKKRTRRSSKYVDLLEVTEIAAHERKSRVKRLNAKKFEDFIENGKMLQPVEYQKLNIDSLDTSLLESGLYDDKPLIFFGKEKSNSAPKMNAAEIEHVLKSFYNYRDILESMEGERMEATHNENLATFGATSLSKLNDAAEDIDALYQEEPYVAIDELEAKLKKQEVEEKVTTKTKPRFQSKRHVDEVAERLAKERALQLNLKSYLQVCAATGALNRGLSTIIMYRQRCKKGKNFITIDMYNTLLHGYAEKGSFERFKHIFQLIEEDQLRYNEQTFAAIFECLGRVEETPENLKLIESFIGQAKDMGFTLNQIMENSKFTSDQRDIALDAIQRIEPDFKPAYTPPVLGYENPLLNNLNKSIKPIQTKEAANEAAAAAAQTVAAAENIMRSKLGFTAAELKEMARTQLQTELDGSITIKSIEKPTEYANSELCREKLKELEQLWRTQISAAIVRDLNTLRAQVRFKPNGYMNYYTHLKSIDTAHFVDILIKEIYKLAEGSETFSPTVSQLYRELGQKVQQRFNIEQKKANGTLEKMGEIYSAYCTHWESANSSDNTRQMWQRLVHEARESGPSMDLRPLNWPVNVLTSVGRFLYNILMRDIKIDTQLLRKKSSKSKQQQQQQQNLMPAFYTLFRNHGRLVKEEVKPHPVLARIFRASQQQTLTFDSNLVPMLCPPQPWTTPHTGGYLLQKCDLIRLPHQAIQQWERINAAKPQSLYPALDSLNQLASVAWRVNTDILDIIIEVFQSGGDHKINVPQSPSTLPPLPSIHKSDNSLTNEERVNLFKEKLGHRRKQAEMYSLWCDTLYRLSLANHYRDKVFWLPHNMDFRGRVYPIPPHLNHLGSDLARSILVFNQAQPLGVDGFSWLKLHCINLTGLKKRDSIRERLLYAEEVMPEILDSADKPLTGRMWWAKSDEPWQTLACCIEIAKVQRSGNPEAYLSHFPIHQDGSCNGLQHYAALGRDAAGAYSVNLTPSPIPQDVYSTVAAKVEKTRKADAANGLHVAQALEGFVRRKVIKQTVMTTVYGVTRYGARLQIARQLKDINDFPKDWVWPASTYLTTKTFESLREMFTSTREIQDWFTDCARFISGSCAQNVEWVTPLGLPVVQPYNRHELKSGYTRIGARVSDQMSTDLFERPNVMKQKNAFPPNFIHSLDSSHMFLTSIHSEHVGITFISVHDCFWTHANSVPDLNRICREQFVALHSQPILEDLASFLQKRYALNESIDAVNNGVVELSKRKSVLCNMPKKGNFDLRNVLDSVYFFS